jgi:hypothetical protein
MIDTALPGDGDPGAGSLAPGDQVALTPYSVVILQATR